jgi:hypothetical protein
MVINNFLLPKNFLILTIGIYFEGSGSVITTIHPRTSYISVFFDHKPLEKKVKLKSS